MVGCVAATIRLLSVGASFLLLLMFIYVEWTYLRDNLLQLFNPFLHLMVILSMLLTVEFWVLATVAVGGGYLADRMSSPKQPRSAEIHKTTRASREG